MKSFDARLENDLFPETPAVFDQMVKQTIKVVCAQSEEPKTSAERSWNAENGKRRLRKSAGILKRVGLIIATSVLAVCIVAVGAITFLARNARTLPAATGLSEFITALEQYEGDGDSKVDFVFAINLPAENNEVQSGTADKSDFVNYLKNADWKIQEAPEQSLPDRGCMEFFLGSFFFMRIYKEECLAVVSHNGETRYYGIGSEDYEAAFSLLQHKTIMHRDDFKILDVDTQIQSGNVTFTVHYTASTDGYWYLWNSYPHGGGAECMGEFSKGDSSFSFTVSAEEELNRYNRELGGRVQEWNIYLSSVVMGNRTSPEGLLDSWQIGDRSFFENIDPEAKLEDYESLNLKILSVEKTRAQSGEVTFTVNYSSSVDGYWYLMCNFESGGYPVQRGNFSKGTSSFSVTVSAEEELKRSDGFLGGKALSWEIELLADLGSDQNVRLYDSQHVVDRSFFEQIAPNVEPDDFEILDVETTQSPSGEVTFTVHYNSSVDGYWYFTCTGMDELDEISGVFSKGKSSFSFTVSAEEELNRISHELGKVQEWDIILSSEDINNSSKQPLMTDSRIVNRSFFENVVSGQSGN